MKEIYKWTYIYKHEIIGSTVPIEGGYPIRIEVNYGRGESSGGRVYVGGRCRPDFGDIRFYASDGDTELPYFIETKTDGYRAVFWVKVYDIPPYPEKTHFYMVCGKPELTTTSNPHAVFEFFDDFTGYPVGTGLRDVPGWRVLYDPPDYPAQICNYQGVRHLCLTNSCIQRDMPMDAGVRVLVRAAPALCSDGTRNRLLYTYLSTGEVWIDWHPTRAYGIECYYYTGQGDLMNVRLIRRMPAPGGGQIITFLCYSYTWCISGIHRTIELGWYSPRLVMAFDGNVLCNVTDTTFTSLPVFQINATSDRVWYIKFVAISRFVFPEPAHGIWEEIPSPSREDLNTAESVTYTDAWYYDGPRVVEMLYRECMEYEEVGFREVFMDEFLDALFRKARNLHRVGYGYEVRPRDFEALRSIIIDIISDLRRRGIKDPELDEAEAEIRKMPEVKSGYILTGEERYRITMALYHLANVVKKYF